MVLGDFVIKLAIGFISCKKVALSIIGYLSMLNILIVDDDKNLVKTLVLGLQNELGKAVHIDYCHNGSDALELNSQKSFDLIISDFNMPQMNGIELFKQIRSTHEHPILVLITAFGSLELEKEAGQYADAFIAKPFEIPVLVEFINKLTVKTDTSAAARRILVLEDDTYLRRLMIKVLRTGQLEVFEASTLKTARPLLDTYKFDVFIVDIHVTDGQGIDLIREYRELLSKNGTIVILATGESRFRYLEEELGIDMYLEKPIAVQDLVVLVQRWTNQREEEKIQ